MSDLSPRSRAIIDEARDADGPSSTDRARIRAALYSQLGLVGGLTAGTTAGQGTAEAAASPSAGTSGGASALVTASGGAGGALTKLALGVVLATGVGLAGYFLAFDRSSPTGNQAQAPTLGPSVANSPAIVPPEPAVSAPEPAPAPPAPIAEIPTPGSPVTATSTPKATAEKPAQRARGQRRTRRSAQRSAPPSTLADPPAISPSTPEPPSAPAVEPTDEPDAEPPASAAPLHEESRLIRDARRALRQGDAATALQRMVEHEDRFRDGQLVQERQALRIIALCGLGRADQARRETDRFTSRWPSSPHIARIRASCAVSH